MRFTGAELVGTGALAGALGTTSTARGMDPAGNRVVNTDMVSMGLVGIVVPAVANVAIHVVASRRMLLAHVSSFCVSRC